MRKRLLAYMAFLTTFLLPFIGMAEDEEPKEAAQKSGIPFGDMILGWLFTILIWLKNWVWPFDNGEYAWLRLICMLLSFGWMAWPSKGLRTVLNYIGGLVVAIIAFVFVAGILLSIPSIIWNLVGWPDWLKILIIAGILFLFGGLIWGLVKRWLGSFLTVFSWARTIPGRIKNAAHPVWMILGGLALAGLICHERTVMFTAEKTFAGLIPVLSAAVGGVLILYWGYQTAFGKGIQQLVRDKVTLKPDADGNVQCFRLKVTINPAFNAVKMERCKKHLTGDNLVCPGCGAPHPYSVKCKCGEKLVRDSFELPVHCKCGEAHLPYWRKSELKGRIHGGMVNPRAFPDVEAEQVAALPTPQAPVGSPPAAQPGTQPVGTPPAAQPGPQIRTEEIELDDDGDIVKGSASCWITEQAECPACKRAVEAQHSTCSNCGHALRRTTTNRRTNESLPRSLFDFLQETTP